MQRNISILLVLMVSAIMLGCKGLNPQPVNPPSQETLALREKYTDKIVGDWTYEALVDTAKDYRLFEQYHFKANGEVIGMVRYGTEDSVMIKWNECEVGATGEYCSPTYEHNFRYELNDTITGRWELVANLRDGEDALVIYLEKGTTDARRRQTYDAFLSFGDPSYRKFRFCNGSQLFMDNYYHKEAVFSKGVGVPHF